MNLLFVILQEPVAQQGGGSGMSFILMMIAIFAIMYFLMIRPQQKKQKQLNEFRKNLQRGDKVVTVGGIYGTIDDIDDRYVFLIVCKDFKIKVDKSSVVKDMSDVPQR